MEGCPPFGYPNKPLLQNTTVIHVSAGRTQLRESNSASKGNYRRQLYLDKQANYETFKDNSVFLNLQGTN